MFQIARLAAALLLAMTSGVMAETHTVEFINKCGHGTPTIVQGTRVLSTGANFISDGPLINATAYLQTGSCGLDGENCTAVEMTLRNPTSPGQGSVVDVTLVPPHKFSVPTGFAYFNGCDGAGFDCTMPECRAPFQIPGAGPFQVACQADNVNIAVTFCD